MVQCYLEELHQATCLSKVPFHFQICHFQVDLLVDLLQQKRKKLMLGMVTNIKSITTIFSHKYFNQNSKIIAKKWHL